MQRSEKFSSFLPYYDASGGGVTFSGGECLLSPNYLAEVAKRCKEHGIHTAVESALCVPWENVSRVLPFIDLFFADLKIPDPEKHRYFTGRDNRQIIENIRTLSERHGNVILRIPMIPAVNDTDADIDGFAEIIRTLGTGIRSVELLRYNCLAESKYLLVGKAYEKYAEGAQSDAEMDRLCTALSERITVDCYFV